jgi:hypothetical protein
MKKLPPWLMNSSSKMGMKGHPDKESKKEDKGDTMPEGKETKANSKKKATFKPFKNGGKVC